MTSVQYDVQDTGEPAEEVNTPMDVGSEVSLEDDDDVGDLQIPDADKLKGAWLVKLPKFLYEAWSDLEEEVDLGSVLIYGDAAGPDANKVKLLLADNKKHEGMPKEYELQIINRDVQNSFSFNMNRRTGAVALSSHILHICHARPTLSEHYSKKLKERQNIADRPKRTTKMMNEGRGAYVPPGSSGNAIHKFGQLVPKKPKVTIEQKTTRMPRNLLTDKLFEAFEQFTYWTLKGLKDYVKQPESYLKEVLSEIAVLDKKGTYNNCYHLKSQYSRGAEHESIAPLGMNAGESVADDEEEEEDEMQVEDDEDLDDVKLEESDD